MEKITNLIHFLLLFTLTKFLIFLCNVAEPPYFYAAPAPGKNFNAALAPAPTIQGTIFKMD
jgi:hypothetical protein